MTKEFEKTIILQGIGRSQDAFPYVSDGITQTEATLRIPDKEALPLLRSRRVITEANLVDDVRIRTLVLDASYFQPFDGAFDRVMRFYQAMGGPKIDTVEPHIAAEDVVSNTLNWVSTNTPGAISDKIKAALQAVGGGMGNFVSTSFDIYPEQPTLKVDVTLEAFAPTAGVNLSYEKGDLSAMADFELDYEIHETYVRHERQQTESSKNPTP